MKPINVKVIQVLLNLCVCWPLYFRLKEFLKFGEVFLVSKFEVFSRRNSLWTTKKLFDSWTTKNWWIPQANKRQRFAFRKRIVLWILDCRTGLHCDKIGKNILQITSHLQNGIYFKHKLILMIYWIRVFWNDILYL